MHTYLFYHKHINSITSAAAILSSIYTYHHKMLSL